jgi:hypothetical protein
MSRIAAHLLPAKYQAQLAAQLHGVPPTVAKSAAVAIKPPVAKPATPATRRFFSALSTDGLPQPVCEHRFHATRKWRLDYFWPSAKLALEVQGGIFIQGRHSQGAALLKEWEKLNTAASALGIRFLFCQPKDLCSQELLNHIRSALKSP